MKSFKAGRSASFFSSNLRSLRSALRKAFNKAKSKKPKDIVLRKRAQSEYIRKNNRQKKQQVCNTTVSSKSAATLMRSLSKDPISSIGTLKLPSGEFTDSPEATLQHLLETHFPGCNDSPIMIAPTTIPPFSLPINGDKATAEQIVSVEKIRWAVESFSPFKSAGEDGIFPSILQHSINNVVDHLYNIFVASLHLQHIPQIWRGVRVVFIPKLGKISYQLSKSFRPISLTSFVLKTLEKLIDRHLRDGILRTFTIHPKQYAYQPKKSAETALHHLISKIDKAFLQDCEALGCFIDIEGAFNNVIFIAIVKACRSHGINDTITGWIIAMLSTRIVSSYLGLIKISVFVSKGCPQGGILPPLIYCLVKDSLLTLLNNAGYFFPKFRR